LIILELTFSKRMAGIASLPDELLLYIFTRGCDDENEMWTGSHLRRRKDFVIPLRRVCKHWKSIVDDTANSHFWIARARLSHEQGPNLPGQDRHYIANEIRKFQQTLQSSSGCDVIIDLFYSEPDRSTLSFDELPLEEQFKVRLFIHAMNMITPFWKQITSLSFYSVQFQLCRHLVALLDHYDSFPRLTKLEISIPTTNYLYVNGLMRRLHNLWEISSAPGFDRLLGQEARSTDLPSLRRCFTNINVMEIPHLSWITEANIPFYLSHLIVLLISTPNGNQEDDNLLRRFSSWKSLQFNLTYLHLFVEISTTNAPSLTTIGITDDRLSLH
jgi:hypothetical protein